MQTQQIISPTKVAIIQLNSEEPWVRLVLRLTDEFTEGELVRFAQDAKVSIEGTDDLSSSYVRSNWVSGVASGAFYAFRALRIPRQHVELAELTGRLRAADMEIVAKGTVIAIAKLVGKDLPHQLTEEWTIDAQVSELRRPIPPSAPEKLYSDGQTNGVAELPRQLPNPAGCEGAVPLVHAEKLMEP